MNSTNEEHKKKEFESGIHRKKKLRMVVEPLPDLEYTEEEVQRITDEIDKEFRKELLKELDEQVLEDLRHQLNLFGR